MEKITKQQMLDEYLVTGGIVNPLMALDEFGISPTAYHRRIGDFKESHRNFHVNSKWVKTKNSRYKIHWATPV